MTQTSSVYEFGPFRLNPAERLLTRNGQPIQLTPKAFETLLLLAQHSGRVLDKNRLMQEIWPDSFVEETNLAQNISILRKALGEGQDGMKLIETVPKLGYRFVMPVSELRADQISPQPASGMIIRERTRSRIIIEEDDDDPTLNGFPAALQPPIEIAARPGAPLLPPVPKVIRRSLETRYAHSGDVNIAYQIVGDGPIDLVFVMGWVSHLDYFWEEPSFAYFLNRLASFARLIIFDKRGTGLSDRVPLNQLPTLEQRMDDVRAVMEAAGSERAVLCGVSEGGPMCSLFAATCPEKTIALVMIGTYARRLKDKDYPWGPTAEEREHFFTEIQNNWGGPVGLEERAPSLAHDERFRQWWATYLRMGASPGAALALTKMNADIDIRRVLPSIRVPTLVIHRSDDALLRVEEGRYIASQIPGAKFVELPGADHLPFVGDQDAILDEIEEFLTGMRHAPEYDRVLATVLSTRVLDETAGQQSEVIDRHYAYVRKEIELFRGRVSEFSSDGVIATFDGPARAIRCACAINEAAQRLGLLAQTGVHTGECDLMGDSIGGVAVTICSQVAAEARPGEVLVSSTVRDLVAGSGIRFADRGMHELAEVAEEWRLFAVD
jgi:pimeloyl-ACP methyl ester carboxylesterase/DNA-binding winged helix-turn-helix (wHTH) protein